jgi:hypothetical protein
MTEQIFEQSVGVILDIKIWSGAKKLKDEDFAGIELPPEELVSLGSKRIHNKETLKPLQAVRTKAITALEGVAVSLYGGKVWLLPEDRADDLQTTLEGLYAEFEVEKTQFLEDFYNQQQQWLEHNRKWAAILEPYLETPDSVEKKFAFAWRTFKISPAQNDGLATSVSCDMTSALMREVSHLATEAYDTLKDRDRATPKNLNRLDRLVSKLKGLAFVDPGVCIIEQEITQILDSRDANGVLSGSNVFHLACLLVQLKNPQVLNEILDAARNGNSYQFSYDPVADASSVTPDPTTPSSAGIRPVSPIRLPDAWF